MNIPERVEENKSPVESKALPHENVVFRCWNPDCRKVATCRDGSGWEWCDDHVDQEKTGSVLHTAQEYYDVDFYKERIRHALTETDQQAREEVAERIAWLDRIAESYLHVEATGTPNDSVRGQIHGFKQAYNIIKTGLIDSPLSLSNPPSQV